MHDTLRIEQLTEQLTALEDLIIYINQKPDSVKTKDDSIRLAECLSQRSLIEYEMRRLHSAEQAIGGL